MSELKYNEVDVIAYGSLGYSNKKMAVLLRVDESDIEKAMKDEFGRSYAFGEAKFNFEMDKKLMQMAVGGDIRALQELDKRKRRNKV